MKNAVRKSLESTEKVWRVRREFGEYKAREFGEQERRQTKERDKHLEERDGGERRNNGRLPHFGL